MSLSLHSCEVSWISKNFFIFGSISNQPRFVANRHVLKLQWFVWIIIPLDYAIYIFKHWIDVSILNISCHHPYLSIGKFIKWVNSIMLRGEISHGLLRNTLKEYPSYRLRPPDIVPNHKKPSASLSKEKLWYSLLSREKIQHP